VFQLRGYASTKAILLAQLERLPHACPHHTHRSTRLSHLPSNWSNSVSVRTHHGPVGEEQSVGSSGEALWLFLMCRRDRHLFSALIMVIMLLVITLMKSLRETNHRLHLRQKLNAENRRIVTLTLIRTDYAFRCQSFANFDKTATHSLKML
jgi:hypothetical protein